MTNTFFESRLQTLASNYKFRCNDVLLSKYLIKNVNEQVKSFLTKHTELLKNTNLSVNMKKTRIKKKGINEFECKLNIVTKAGIFNSKSKAIGIKKALKTAINAAQMQLLAIKSKRAKRIISRDKDPYMLTDYFEET